MPVLLGSASGPDASKTTQIDLACYHALARLWVLIERGKFHSVDTNLLDHKASASVAVYLFGPANAEVNRISAAVAAKARCSSARTDI
jgi:hypothetical protein